MQLLPTPAPPNITNRIRSKSDIFVSPASLPPKFAAATFVVLPTIAASTVCCSTASLFFSLLCLAKWIDVIFLSFFVRSIFLLCALCLFGHFTFHRVFFSSLCYVWVDLPYRVQSGLVVDVVVLNRTWQQPNELNVLISMFLWVRLSRCLPFSFAHSLFRSPTRN